MAQRFVDQFEVRTLAPDKATLEELSGGNQQKVVLAKGLARKPLVAIIDEPTRGVDLGAIPEIHAMIRALADDGVEVVVISSYLPRSRHCPIGSWWHARAASQPSSHRRKPTRRASCSRRLH
ncbi:MULTISPECIES: ATP-binding cassette domain-containing protein [unclassified Rhodococcus (in: high G+C Gram-positive bacteria)]|uniref:ATP-binding cassette domain-containing protein n=1 Tax=unclassified Rhodococcus (in: high G+C Gram-positive bacteria) TaxID=192944 RepID=UPI001BB38765|nr:MULTISPECIES: ATP-binding cassette domain-containing protein [unclassified Rhodococcus (in: high G+C Gram-positive bacteria)]